MRIKPSGLCFVCLALALTCAAQTAPEKKGSGPGAKDERTPAGRAATNFLSDVLAPVGVQVRADVPPPPARSHREVTIRWDADKANAPAGKTPAAQYQDRAGVFSVTAAGRRREGGLPKRRSAELSQWHILLVAVDGENRLRWWELLNDPRLIRAESPGPNGELGGQVLFREGAEFAVDYPDDEAITELRLYHPDWNGKNFSLRLIGSVAAFRGP